MLNIVRQYLPNNWDEDLGKTVELSTHSEEYKKVVNSVNEALGVFSSIGNKKRIERVQDIYSYGQFLIREQQLLKSESSNLYRVRMFIQVQRTYAEEIVKYNLDPRRCGLGRDLSFYTTLNFFDSDKIIVVVKVLVTDIISNEITIKNSSDYYVEYIIHP